MIPPCTHFCKQYCIRLIVDYFQILRVLVRCSFLRQIAFKKLGGIVMIFDAGKVSNLNL